MTDLQTLIRLLSDAKVEYILVGGVAAVAHGSARLTQDLDIVYDRSVQNIRRIIRVLAPYRPYLRGAPPGLPFIWDEQTIYRGLNFTLTTSLGDIDLLGEIVGGGTFKDLLPHCITLKVFGIECYCLNLDKLIEVKRAAGRPRDLESIAELEVIREQAHGKNPE
ncbi:MAG: hypothetical protein JRH18_22695 [Deltaproteobacteria bacterium]|nr:hypothetical protein [Deltaproteobacteria bacterium]MBW1962511.1 hypothetical protein [Deltaproteobacteria bacterium]MBW2154458.1 hypothetical protein [Deltaproteobacteria bacterium]